MDKPKRRQQPATSLELREKQLISNAVDLAEKKIKDGSASSMLILHYLKLGTTMAELEKEKLRHENALLQARTAAIASSEKTEELYRQALSAMRKYSGSVEEESLDDD